MREDFRNHLATADKHGRRRWLFPKRVDGKWYRLRSRLSWILLGLMFAGPFIQINGNPLLMLNIVERRFSILGQIFWPQDAAIFAIAMLIFFTGIVVFTAALAGCPPAEGETRGRSRTLSTLEQDHAQYQKRRVGNHAESPAAVSVTNRSGTASTA